jgi:tetratricopeptide (TPR) repeat protein
MTQKTSKKSLSRIQLLIFRLLALVVVPVVLLLGIELGLRLFGFGYSTDFFVESELDGQQYWRENPKALWRFMPPAMARQPRPQMIPVNKSDDVIRIFVLGESAALGDPEPAYSMGRILKTLLQHQFPDQQFEVINTAITAINSHVILPMAEELAEMNGDYWLVYMGNNEVLGPFGPGTVLGDQMPPPWLLNLSLKAKTTRLGQLASGLIGGSGASSGKEWTGLRMFMEQTLKDSDPRLEAVQNVFQSNLKSILEEAMQSGVRVALSTVPVNQVDHAPFSSSDPNSLSPDEAKLWEESMTQGKQLMDSDLFAEALNAFQQIESLGDTHAELQWLIGHCLSRLEQKETSLPYFRKALQLDTLRFRADQRINQAIRNSAKEHGGDWLHLVDAEAALTSKASNGLPGDDLFWDHVHMKFQGNYLIALLTADWIAKDLQAQSKLKSKDPLQWLSVRDAAKYLGLTLWSDYQMTSQMLQRLNQAPFNQMANHVQRMERLKSQMEQQSRGLQADAFDPQASVYLGLIRMHRSDWVYQDQFAKYLESFGHKEKAITTWREVLKIVPHYLVGRYQLAMLLGENAATAEEAETIARALIKERSNAPEFHRALGRALYAQSKDKEAVIAFRKAYALRESDIESLMMLGAGLEAAGEDQEAIKIFEKALDLSPDLETAHQSLASLYRRIGNDAKAVFHENKVEASQPANDEETIELFP